MWKFFLNKSFLQRFKWQIIIGACWSVLSALFVPIIIAMIILGPIAGGISGANSSPGTSTSNAGDVSNNEQYVPGTETGNFWDSLSNFFSLRGFKSTETIFFERLRNIMDTHGDQIDVPLILSTLYYPFDVYYNQRVNQCLNDESSQDSPACEQIIGDYNNSNEEETNDQNDQVVAHIAINGRLDVLVNNMLNTSIAGPDYEKYNKFLTDHYIQESPEFGYPWGIDENKLPQKIITIVQEINARAVYYNNMFRSSSGGTNFGDYTIKLLVARNLFQSPVRGAYHLSSCFGSRKDPASGAWTVHNGTDIVIEADDKSVYAAADGIVISYNNTATGSCFSNCTDAQKPGNYVQIYHNLGGTILTTLYAHLSSVTDNVINGTTATIDGITGVQIKKGDKIGVEGTTGNSTGAHLHFEVRQGGVALMPSTGSFQYGTAINPGYYVFANPTKVGDNCPEYIAPTPGGGTNPIANVPPGASAANIVTVGAAMFNSTHPIYTNKNLCYISPPASAIRANTYNGIPNAEGYFLTDCNGFVGLVLRDALKIGPKVASGSGFKFFSPGSYKMSDGRHVWGPMGNYKSLFTLITAYQERDTIINMIKSGSILPGDIIGFNPNPSGGGGQHIAVFGNGGKLIENTGPAHRCPNGHAIKYRSFTQSNHYNDGSRYTIWRYTGK